MGVSVATVRRMEGEELQPVIIDGKHCFALEELDRHRKVTDGDLAAKAFEMFNADKTQVDVVIALKEPPERIRLLFQDWVGMSECIVAGAPGISGRRLQSMLKSRLTRRLVWICLNIVFRDPGLKSRAEASSATRRNVSMVHPAGATSKRVAGARERCDRRPSGRLFSPVEDEPAVQPASGR